MINYIKHNVTDTKCGIVAHGCNCQGVMGSGVALAIRKKWPAVFDPYAYLCTEAKEHGYPLLGEVNFVMVEYEQSHVTWEGVSGIGTRTIIVANMFTQDRYGKDGKVYADLRAISLGLEDVLQKAVKHRIPVYMPRIGCGLGGLNWDEQVGPVVEKLADIYSNVTIYICDL